MDKVAKTQSSQREGQALQQAIQGAQIQKKTEEHIQEVNEAQNTGEGAEKINDHGQREQPGSGNKEKGQKNDSPGGGEDVQPSILRDPSLGQNIDISL
jgi:hypothetical protein